MAAVVPRYRVNRFWLRVLVAILVKNTHDNLTKLTLLISNYEIKIVIIVIILITGQRQMATLTDKWYKEVSQRSTTEESEEDDLFDIPADRQPLVHNNNAF